VRSVSSDCVCVHVCLVNACVCGVSSECVCVLVCAVYLMSVFVCMSV